MKENTYKPQIPDMMEAIFDAVYLIFDLVAAILFFIYAKGNTLFVLYGILTLTLCGGDAFHLVPRIIRAVRGTSDKLKRQLSIGLQVSSITMTVFYIILMYIWKLTFPEFTIPVAIEAIVWISAVVRIVICLFPQNNWCTDEGNMKLSIIRNTVFAVTGIGVIILYVISGNANGYHMTRNGCSDYYFVWLLSSGNVIQQNKTEGWIIDDSKDMRLYVGYSDGTPAFILSS